VAEDRQSLAVSAAPRLGALATVLATGFPGVSRASVEQGELVVHASADMVLPLMMALRDDPRALFEQLVDLCGVDWPQRAERFDVVYNLLSVSLNHRVRVVVTTDEVRAVPSVSGIWPCATWWERECWDLYGHPLRKDFPLTGYVEVRYDEDRKQVIYEKVRLTQDFRNFDFLSPWEAMTSLPGDEKAHVARLAGVPPVTVEGPAS
jgi:NADH-quinone oxidoreductase subunit C